VKALVPCGGAGTRLRPITHTSAKQLVPVANKPILFYALESLAAARIVEVAIVVGDTREEVMAAVGDGSAWGLKVTYLPQEEPLGLAHCVLLGREFLGDDDFVMYLGDNLLRQGITSFVDAFEEERRPPPSSWRGCPTPTASGWPSSTATAGSSASWRSPRTRRRTSPSWACTSSTPASTTRWPP
jgi:glucose-1-phosphate thymidylyltransferase